jgi:integrase
MDQVMLTLLSHLTGRRLSALIYLRGRDIFEKYPDIWVAQPSDFVEINGERRRVPLKTDESRQFFVLHRFLHEIGSVEWAVTCKDQFLFPDLMRMQDPSKTASQYMQRLFAKAGVLPGRGEVFHSLRGDCIEQLRAREPPPSGAHREYPASRS